MTTRSPTLSSAIATEREALAARRRRNTAFLETLRPAWEGDRDAVARREMELEDAAIDRRRGVRMCEED